MAEVSASTSAITLVEAAKGTGRQVASVYYDGPAILYLLAGSGTPSSTNFTVKLGAGYFNLWESPPVYRGEVRGIWSAATGAAYTTEYA